MASSDVVKKPLSRRTPAAGRTGRATAVLGGVRRTTVLLVLAAVILSLGMVAGNGSGEDRTASFSEIAQTDARAGVLELARQADSLAGDGRSGPLAAELFRQAEVLADQSALLVRPGTFRRGVPPFAAASSGAVPGDGARASGSQATDAEATAEYVRSLTVSARSSLDAALRADEGTARLLAATGAARQVLALRAAEAAGVDSPALWTPLQPSAGESPCGPDAGDSELPEPAGSPANPSGTGGDAVPDAAAALQGAVDAEYGAAYAYEVAMARTAGVVARGELDERREEHVAAGAEGVALLADACLPAFVPAPAYSLPPSFHDPVQALEDLEASLPAVYADVAALGTGAVRAWGVERLAGLSTVLYAQTRSVPAAPGLPQAEAGLPQPAGTP